MEINSYTINDDNLFKSFCLLAEKCFYADLNTVVFTKNDDDLSILDKTLWTYSQKHFIPHATMNDQHPEKQPIFISNKYENPNSSKIFILFRPGISDLIDFFLFASQHKPTKLMLVLAKSSAISEKELEDSIKKSTLKFNAIKYFEQNLDGKWLQKN